MSNFAPIAPSRPDEATASAGRVSPPSGPTRLLFAAGRPGKPLSLAEHLGRVGELPPVVSRGPSRRSGPTDRLIEMVERSGLRGRGGAAFPAGRKMRAVANGRRRPLVVVNGAEGEPASLKDVSLLAAAPHLVLDGAVLAAAAVGAAGVLVAIRRGPRAAHSAVAAALGARSEAGIDPIPIRLFDVPDRYVAGEETALVRWLNGGPAKPAFTPPRPFERGVGGRPTLVQNVETVAHLALIARFGDGWFREVGLPNDAGSTLVTVSGAVERPGVYEVALGSPVSDAVSAAGGATEPARAFLVGGFFGGWVPACESDRALLTHEAMPGVPRLGCGVLVVLPESACPVRETALVLRFLAAETADQCGPCVFGLPAMAKAMAELYAGGGSRTRDRLLRWSGQLQGRGACRHPDTAVSLVRSLLDVFEDEVATHDRGVCTGGNTRAIVPLPGGRSSQEWR